MYLIDASIWTIISEYIYSSKDFMSIFLLDKNIYNFIKRCLIFSQWDATVPWVTRIFGFNPSITSEIYCYICDKCKNNINYTYSYYNKNQEICPLCASFNYCLFNHTNIKKYIVWDYNNNFRHYQKIYWDCLSIVSDVSDIYANYDYYDNYSLYSYECGTDMYYYYMRDQQEYIEYYYLDETILSLKNKREKRRIRSKLKKIKKRKLKKKIKQKSNKKYLRKTKYKNFYLKRFYI